MQGAVWIAVILTQAFLGKRRPRRPVESEPGIEAVRDPHRFGPGQHDKGGGDRDGHVLDEDPVWWTSASVSSTGAKQYWRFSGSVPAVRTAEGHRSARCAGVHQDVQVAIGEISLSTST